MIWVLFFVIIAGFLALDLGVFHRENERVSMKQSILWTGVWVLAASLFGIAIYWIYEYNWFDVNLHGINGSKALVQYFTGYVIEESLSLDNIFVIAIIFRFFQIEQRFQHRILFWGIIGAVFFRLIMILLGSAFVEHASWAMYVFGGILLISAYKMIREDDEVENFKNSLPIRILNRIYPIDWTVKDGTYLTQKKGRTYATTLLAALVVVEFSDILFAVDSIPAIFSVTREPFIVFTSNIFAILGLRNLYFFLANMMDKFRYMKYSLIFVLMFVGFKMIFHRYLEVLTENTWIPLVIILGALLLGILASLTTDSKKTKKRSKKHA